MQSILSLSSFPKLENITFQSLGAIKPPKGFKRLKQFKAKQHSPPSNGLEGLKSSKYLERLSTLSLHSGQLCLHLPEETAKSTPFPAFLLFRDITIYDIKGALKKISLELERYQRKSCLELSPP